MTDSGEDVPLGDRVFPRPREVVVAGGRGSPVEVAAEPCTTLPAQGYELTIGPEGTTVAYADELGLRYARHTLAQLAAGKERVVPAGLIRDWPDFAHRGFMLDISRDRVPTMATLEWLVDRLADLRCNHLELYTEHTFAYTDHEAVWRDASPITATELRQLDQRCRARGIELSANQNTFGHMNRWLSHPDYRPRAECPDGFDHPLFGVPFPPWSLEPTPDNAAFAIELLREMASHLRSRRLHVNADEPWDLGLGRSRALVERRDRARVFVDHLRRIVDPLVADGDEVLFWGDGLVRHPELVSELPAVGATAVVWHYEAPRANDGRSGFTIDAELAELLGMPDRPELGFASYVRSFAEAGYPFWVAPGTSSWNSLVGRWTNARRNLLDAAATGLDAGARGYLIADWGDNGHHQPLPVSLLPLAYGAGVAWCATANRDVDVAPVVDRLLEARTGVGARLAQLGDIYRQLGVTAVNGTPLSMAMMSSSIPTARFRGRLTSAVADQVDEIISDAIDHMASTPFTGPRAAAVAAELSATCRLLRHGLWRLRTMYGSGTVDPDRLARDFREAVDLQRQAWLATSRPGGLEDSINWLGRTDH